MALSRWFTSSRLFFLLGLGLVILAFGTFPMRTAILDHAVAGGVEYFRVGWLFTPVILVWGLVSLILGLVQSCSRKAETLLLIIDAFVLVMLAFGLSFAVIMAAFYGSVIASTLAEPFWWLYLTLTLVPCGLVLAFSAMFYRKREKMDLMLSKWKVKAASFAAVSSVPLVYFAGLLFYLKLL